MYKALQMDVGRSYHIFTLISILILVCPLVRNFFTPLNVHCTHTHVWCNVWALECFSKDTLWKIKKPTPSRNRGMPRENISRRRDSTNKSRELSFLVTAPAQCREYLSRVSLRILQTLTLIPVTKISGAHYLYFLETLYNSSWEMSMLYTE